MTAFTTFRNRALASTAAAVLLAPAALAVEDTEGKWLADLRLRYETVDDANCTACAGQDATAFTLRARLGYDTGTWQGFGGLIEIDQIWSLGDEDYNSTRNGQTLYPVVADPELTQLNRLQISYGGSFDTVFTLVTPTVRAHLHLLSALAFLLRDGPFREAVVARAEAPVLLARAAEAGKAGG